MEIATCCVEIELMKLRYRKRRAFHYAALKRITELRMRKTRRWEFARRDITSRQNITSWQITLREWNFHRRCRFEP